MLVIRPLRAKRRVRSTAQNIEADVLSREAGLVAAPGHEGKAGEGAIAARDKGGEAHVARVMLVGVVALSSVKVIAVVLPSSFLAVSVVETMAKSISIERSM